MKIVLDSDVVIAGLISSRGGGRFLLQKILPHRSIKILTSRQQLKEITQVFQRQTFGWKPSSRLWQRFQNRALTLKLPPLSRFYSYLKDPNDAHILAAAVTGQASFLISYNLRDYLADKIKNDFDVLVVRPGYFIQFLRESDQYGDLGS